VAICLERGIDCLHIVHCPADATASQNPVISCLILIQTGLTFLVPAYLGCPGKEAVKWVLLLLLLSVSYSAMSNVPI